MGAEITPAALSNPQTTQRLQRFFAECPRPCLSLILVRDRGECLLEFELIIRYPQEEAPA